MRSIHRSGGGSFAFHFPTCVAATYRCVKANKIDGMVTPKGVDHRLPIRWSLMSASQLDFLGAAAEVNWCCLCFRVFLMSRQHLIDALMGYGQNKRKGSMTYERPLYKTQLHGSGISRMKTISRRLKIAWQWFIEMAI